MNISNPYYFRLLNFEVICKHKFYPNDFDLSENFTVYLIVDKKTGYIYIYCQGNFTPLLDNNGNPTRTKYWERDTK